MKFIRTDFWRYSKIGKNRKKLQKWRKPKGRDNKLREKRKGYPRVVSVGFKGKTQESGKIRGVSTIRVFNTKDLEKMKKGQGIIIAKVGAKNRIEIIKKAESIGLKIVNIKQEKGK